jgi:hypothetical protein
MQGSHPIVTENQRVGAYLIEVKTGTWVAGFPDRDQEASGIVVSTIPGGSIGTTAIHRRAAIHDEPRSA